MTTKTSSHTQARKKKHAGHTDKSSSESRTNSPVTLLRSSALGLVCTVGVGLLFLLIATVVANATADPNAMVQPLALTALYATALFSGMITVRIHGHSSLLCGAIAALLLFMTGLLIGACLPTASTQSIGSTWLTHLPLLPLAIAGAYLARKRTGSTSHRNRHR